MKPEIYIHSFHGEHNIIYHTITDPVSLKSCYPDILIKHNFTEQEITDSNLYELAQKAISQYGSSRCYFISYNNEALLNELIGQINSIYSPCNNSEETKQLIDNFASLLMLSATMQGYLRTLLIYYADFIGNLKELLDSIHKEYHLPVTNKNEGKKIYEHLRQTILG